MIEFLDPKNSVCINASAGNGKTKMLTDRVLRLMLDSESFDSILCITFTNQAAQEIENRILSKLYFWSRKTLEEIKQELRQDWSFIANHNTLKRAQMLYLEYIKSSKKLNIHTIHSFCQKILKIFSLESNISPYFQIISNYQKNSIISKSKNSVLMSEEFQQISQYIFENINEHQLDKLLSEIIENKQKLTINKTNMIDSGEITKFLLEKAKIEKLCSDQYKLFLSDSILQKYIKEHSLCEIRSLFLTKDGKEKNISRNKQFKSDIEYLQNLQIKFSTLEEKKNKSFFLIHSKLIEIIAAHFLIKYEEEKKFLALLDYEDLIIEILNLLNQDHIQPWVLYKLDCKIKHILIDEAQDTNPLQWEIIDKLIQESYLNYNLSNNLTPTKSIFIVGDVKQSIYSFQGADIEYYLNFTKLLKKNFHNANYRFLSHEFFTSYRSSKEINNFVYQIFNYISDNYPEIALPIDKIETKNKFNGIIEIWPLYKNTGNRENPWPIIQDDNLHFFVEKKIINLAKDISCFIKEKLDSNYVLKSQNRPVVASDFLILFRKRSKLVEILQNMLLKSGIKTTLIGKFLINDNIIAQDFIAIAKFILNPYNDLNLASILKSDFIGLNDSELEQILSLNENSEALWEFFKNNSIKQTEEKNTLIESAFSKLKSILQLYKNSPHNNIFLFIAEILQFRKIFNDKFGNEKSDLIINELIYINSNYIKNNNHSLYQFLHWIENSKIELNLEPTNENCVKLMTIHASKGLESPIVIICDAHNVPQHKNNLIWENNACLVKNFAKSAKSNFYQELLAKEKNKLLKEYIRLFYVAITRASEYLVICDIESHIKSNFSWIKIIREAIKNIKHKIVEEKIIIENIE